MRRDGVYCIEMSERRSGYGERFKTNAEKLKENFRGRKEASRTKTRKS